MKAIRQGILIGLATAALVLAAHSSAYGQELSVLGSNDATLTNSIQLTPAAPGSVPGTGTFFFMSSYGQGQADTHGFGLPWPFNPFYGLNLGVAAYTPDTNIWPDWPANGFILDDASVDLGALADGLSTNTGPQLAKLQVAVAFRGGQSQQRPGITGQVGVGRTAVASMSSLSGGPSRAALFNGPTSTNGLQQGASWPRCSAFYSLQHPEWPPQPSNPCSNCNTFALTNDASSFLVDDTGYSYPQQTNSYQADGATGYAPSYANGSFWLSLDAMSNGVAFVTVHGTIAGTSYTLLSTEDLGKPWLVEQDLIGADGQDWTPLQVPTFGRSKLFFWAHVGTDSRPRVFFIQMVGVTSNSVNVRLYSTGAGQTYEILGRDDLFGGDWVSEGLFTGLTNWTPVTVAKSANAAHFLRARSWVDSTGSGIPDCCWLRDFCALGGTDPFAFCPSGDAWTIMQAFQNSWNPLQWHPPPAPAGGYHCKGFQLFWNACINVQASPDGQKIGRAHV